MPRSHLPGSHFLYMFAFQLMIPYGLSRCLVSDECMLKNEPSPFIHPAPSLPTNVYILFWLEKTSGRFSNIKKHP